MSTETKAEKIARHLDVSAHDERIGYLRAIIDLQNGRISDPQAHNDPCGYLEGLLRLRYPRTAEGAERVHCDIVKKNT